MSTVDLPHGTISYRVAGPQDSAAPPVVFVHAFLVDGTVWTQVADLLAADGVRSYAPTWPLGAHRTPMKADADLSPRGLARLILDFLQALDLRDVTLVGSDTGGALVQFLLDTDDSRVGRVVFANCDAFDTFPPFPFSAIFPLLKGPRRLWANLQPMRLRAMRHSPLGFGLLATSFDPRQTRSWIEPTLSDARVRRDAVKFLRAAKPADLLDVSTRLAKFAGPVRVVWGGADRAFKPELGRRLAQAFGDGSYTEVPGARTFVQLDNPRALADEIAHTT